MQITETQERFIRRWGDMGVRWGIPRSTAALHGLLYISKEPITPEEMSRVLKMARSNVSTSLKELEDFRLIYRESHPGDRRSFYTAETDPWEIARRILEERRRREMNGAALAVAECLQAAQDEGDMHTAHRMEAMQELLDAAEAFAQASQKYSTGTFKRAVKMGSKLLGLISS